MRYIYSRCTSDPKKEARKVISNLRLVKGVLVSTVKLAILNG